MAFPRWAIALGATLLLVAPAWAAPQKAESLEFSVSVETISWTASGFVVKTQIENRSGSPDLFLHHVPNLDDPERFAFSPESDAEDARGKRRTFTLKGLTQSRTAATLAFGVDADEDAGLLVVGEMRPPYRQVAIALKPLLPARPAAPSPAPERVASPPAPALSAAERPMSNGDVASMPGVIQSYLPPHPTFGDRLLLREGKAGPGGAGWTRIYTDLPDVTLDDLRRVLETPAQIWQGDDGYLYLRNVGGQRALAVDIRNAEVISARYVTPNTLGQVVGPRTRYPKRVYMGRP